MPPTRNASNSGIPDAHKRALRAWAAGQYPRPSQKACIQWFTETFHRTLSQSTVSDILSSRNEYLDRGQITFSTRHQEGRWPLLDRAVFLWQQRVEKRDGSVTGDALIAKAREFWFQIPQYRNLEPPQFSQGWLSRFKKRHHIKPAVSHGQAVSNSSGQADMSDIRTICTGFANDDIYNMDETGLFWRRTPYTGRSASSQPGMNKDKSRVSLVICTNATGTDRVPLWTIGNAQTPRALRNVNLRAMECVWRPNTIAWMTGEVMAEWLRFFYQRIGTTRRVLLLLDNSSAHQIGLEFAPPPFNITVRFLPSNPTALHQPMDQGIVQNLKFFYRKRWICYIIECLENNVDPHDTMNMYRAIQWVSTAWQCHVPASTVLNCFQKSSCIDEPSLTRIGSSDENDLNPIYNRLTECYKDHDIGEIMSLHDFLNPTDENAFESLETSAPCILSDIIPSQAAIEVEEPLILPPIATSKDAINGIRAAIDYAQHQDEIEPRDLHDLARVEALLERLFFQGK